MYMYKYKLKFVCFVWIYYVIGIVFLVNVSVWFNFVVIGIVGILYWIDINLFIDYNFFDVNMVSNYSFVYCYFYFKIYFFVIKL